MEPILFFEILKNLQTNIVLPDLNWYGSLFEKQTILIKIICEEFTIY